MKPGMHDSFAGYCWHASVLFPTWHRTYTLLMEQVCVCTVFCRKALPTAFLGTVFCGKSLSTASLGLLKHKACLQRSLPSYLTPTVLIIS